MRSSQVRVVQISNAVLGIFVSVEVQGHIEPVLVGLEFEGLKMDELVPFDRHSELEGREEKGEECGTYVCRWAEALK